MVAARRRLARAGHGRRRAGRRPERAAGASALRAGPRHRARGALSSPPPGGWSKPGAPVVKNVSGFDLCRLLVGSLGTLGLLGRGGAALPARSRRLAVVPGGRRRRPLRPGRAGCTGRRRSSGTATRPGSASRATRSTSPTRPGPSSGRRSAEADGPAGSAPEPAAVARRRAAPPAARTGAGAGAGWPRSGVGTVHCRRAGAAGLGAGIAWPPAGAGGRRPAPAVKARFDPGGRLNPGRSRRWRAAPVAGEPRRSVACSAVCRVDDDELAQCVSCGLCLPHCPTYRVTGEEAAVAPGPDRRHAGRCRPGHRSTAPFADFMRRCVQCRACEMACPSAVPFGRLMEGARQALADEPAACRGGSGPPTGCSATTGCCVGPEPSRRRGPAGRAGARPG